MRIPVLRIVFLTCTLIMVLGASAKAEDKSVIAKLSTDYVGNAVEVDSVEDPKVQGVTCYWTHFNRSLIDRIVKMNQSSVFIDPSNSGLSCARTGDQVVIGRIDLTTAGEEIGHEKISLVFRNLEIKRIYDQAHNTLIYVSYSTRILNGSAHSAVAAVPLTGAQVTWTEGAPQTAKP